MPLNLAGNKKQAVGVGTWPGLGSDAATMPAAEALQADRESDLPAISWHTASQMDTMR